MKEKIVEKIRNRKPFEKADVIIYSVCLLLIVSLFILVPLSKNSQENTGFKISVDGKIAVILEFDKEIVVESDYSDLVSIEKKQDLYQVKILTKDKNGYNLIEFDLKEKTAKVIESNCSSSKDCVHFPKIKTSGTIYCAPHKLKISPLKEEFKSPVVGEI